MQRITSVQDLDIDSIPIDQFWNVGAESEQKIHRIHAYPAKFPAFITTKALEYVKYNDFIPRKIGDVFCGCGTTAFEARRNNISFWGCDINPVATLIARVKSKTYQSSRLCRYFNSIVNSFDEITDFPKYDTALPRLKYWYSEQQYNDLSKLKSSIRYTFQNGSKYQEFFLCAFSNILKPASRWLSKSIKPQVDPNKTPQNVLTLFKKQCEFMFRANEENTVKNNATVLIETKNFMDVTSGEHDIDMIITSPPYVTSYEYADLHQLSTLWLGYETDYRQLREGTIGSDHQHHDISETEAVLNDSGKKVVSQLQKTVGRGKSKSVAKYYADMQKVAQNTYNILNAGGYALFVIGNTEYKSVRIDNATHLVESMFAAGFKELQITKRKISNKILTPYRDSMGKFSSNADGRKIYNEEFIILGKK